MERIGSGGRPVEERCNACPFSLFFWFSTVIVAAFAKIRISSRASELIGSPSFQSSESFF